MEGGQISTKKSKQNYFVVPYKSAPEGWCGHCLDDLGLVVRYQGISLYSPAPIIKTDKSKEVNATGMISLPPYFCAETILDRQNEKVRENKRFKYKGEYKDIS